ncbi:phospholipase D-like domain-containing protein [Thermococcus sp.]
MRNIPIIALLLVAMVVSSGCMGAFTGSQTVTVTKTFTTTTTETVTQTETPGKLEPEVSPNLSENLSRCMEKLLPLQEALNRNIERTENLSENYSECLMKLEAQENLSKSLNLCQEELGATQEKLVETTANLTSCIEELENLPNESASVELLIDEEYYHRVLWAIENSNESIYVMTFFMKYDAGDTFDWANDLIRALVSARKRDVEVHVLLDERIDENAETYYYLAANGIDVSFDSPQTTLHAKVVVVDGKLVFIGSHNWSESALYWNHEVSVEIRSRKMAERLIEYFNTVKSGA